MTPPNFSKRCCCNNTDFWPQAQCVDGIMRWVWWIVILCIAAVANAYDLRPEVYVRAPEGMGTGLFYTVEDAFKIAHYEHTRCGPETLSPRQRILCHGVFATCNEWATMSVRTDGVRGYQLFTDHGPVLVEETNEVHLGMALGLSNACRMPVAIT